VHFGFLGAENLTVDFVRAWIEFGADHAGAEFGHNLASV
jgi:hypothetical protein